MNKRVFTLAITLILVIGFEGCREKGTPENSSTLEQSSVSSSDLSSAAPSPAASKTSSDVQDEAGTIHIDLATDELLKKYSSVYEYINDEDGANVIIWTDTTVKDFAFITVNYKESDNSLSYSAGEILFSVDELTPDKPFVVKLLIPGLIPAYGITYVDESGVTRYYSINLDGRGPEEAPPYFLLEFENKK